MRSLREAEQARSVADPDEAVVDREPPASGVVGRRGVGLFLVPEDEAFGEHLRRLVAVATHAQDLSARAAHPVDVRGVEGDRALVEERGLARDRRAGGGSVEREGADPVRALDDEERVRVGDEADERAGGAERRVVRVGEVAPEDEVEERRVRAARAQATLHGEDEASAGGREMRHGPIRVAVADGGGRILVRRVGDVERARAARRGPEEPRSDRDDTCRGVDETPWSDHTRGAAVRGRDGERVDGMDDEEPIGCSDGTRRAGEDLGGGGWRRRVLRDADERAARRDEDVRVGEHEVAGRVGDDLPDAWQGRGGTGPGTGVVLASRRPRVRCGGGTAALVVAVRSGPGRTADGVGAPREEEGREQGEDDGAEHGSAWHEPTADATDVRRVTFPLRLRGTLLGGRYELLDLLGAGGSGAVYEAIDRVTDRLRAVKVALASGDEEARARFAREAKIAGRAESPFLVEIVDHGHDAANKVDFLVMERLRGADLGAVLRERVRFTPAEAATILDQVARGLACLHAEGVVHRDVKPENVFVLENAGPRDLHVKLLDLGIAKRFDVEAARTTAAVGTPAFMAPEQLRGEATIDALSDVYAYGQLAYVLLVGAPYRRRELRAASNLHAYLLAIEGGAPEAASTRANEDGVSLPDGFDAWFSRATALDPLDRFADVEAARQACLEVLGAPSSSAAVALPSAPTTPARGRKGLLLAVGLLALAGITVAMMSARTEHRAISPSASVSPPAPAPAPASPSASASPSAPAPGPASAPSASASPSAPASASPPSPRRAPATPAPAPARDPLDSL